MPQCAKERAKARAEEPSEAPAAAAGRDHYAIIGTRNLATSGFKSRLRSMKVSSRINGEFRFMTGENINSAIISDMGCVVGCGFIMGLIFVLILHHFCSSFVILF